MAEAQPSFSLSNQDTVGEYSNDVEWDRPKKGKLRIMPVSDSPWAPTGFGTNTKNLSCILHKEGHHIGYGGCQNPQHGKWHTPWPLGQTEKKAYFENLTHMYIRAKKRLEKNPLTNGFKTFQTQT